MDIENITRDFLESAATGDIEAFEQIYKAASGFVYNSVVRILLNEEDAREVTQEVFIKVYRSLGGFKYESSFKTWIYRISVNAALNYKKKMSLDAHKMTEYAVSKVTESEPGIGGNNEGVVIEMLSVLTPEQRACVVLREIQGLSYKEIADVLNIDVNAVRSRLKRAREKLVEKLKVPSGVEK
jgi:RNA polymerase sigma-70 factor (ECF subfamily)